MNIQEFSDKFDVKLASYIYKEEFGSINKLSFDEYEKSVFLSQAQEEIVIELYSGRNNKGLSFESTEEARRLLHNLTVKENFEKLDSKEIEISKPEDLWFITSEYCTLQDASFKCVNKENVLIQPVKQDFLIETLNNPFKSPSERRVLRVDLDNKIKLISKFNIVSYTMNYLKKPYPIILIDLEGLSIRGETKSKECELDSSLHDSIIDRAAALAIQSRALLLNNKQ